jgi:hypothetical protein
MDKINKSSKETKIIKCKKCKNKFETEILEINLGKGITPNGEIIDRKSWRYKHTKCELCRNVEKAFDFANRMMI